MNDEECRYVGTSLSTSCRGSADAFARSLQRRFNSLNIGNHDDETQTSAPWYQNGHGLKVDTYAPSPLSPETEIPNPLSNGNHFINPELFLNTKPIEFAACDRSSALISENFYKSGSDFGIQETESAVNSSENVVDSSSVDDNYETASDLSADENVSVEVLDIEAPTADLSSQINEVQEEQETSDVSISFFFHYKPHQSIPVWDTIIAIR